MAYIYSYIYTLSGCCALTLPSPTQGWGGHLTRARDPVLTLFRGGFTLIFPEDTRGFTVWTSTGFDPYLVVWGQDPI